MLSTVNILLMFELSKFSVNNIQAVLKILEISLWTGTGVVLTHCDHSSRCFIGFLCDLWIFIRTDAEAETPILWLPDAKNWLVWKDPDAGKDLRQEEKGMTEDGMVGCHHQLNGHSWSKLRELVMDREASVLQSTGLQRVGHYWVTELNWTEEMCRKSLFMTWGCLFI